MRIRQSELREHLFATFDSKLVRKARRRTKIEVIAV
jgi:hypothetical protein